MIRMKTKFLFASCVLAAAITGCQNEEFEAVNVGGQAASDLVEVGDNFMISGVGAVAPGTRTHWVLGNGVLSNAFIPVYGDEVPEGMKGYVTELNGSVSVVAPTIGACALVGGNVYSNYEFYHYGWLAAGVTAGAEFNPCLDANGNLQLNNGWLYSEVKLTNDDSSSKEGEEVTGITASDFNLDSDNNKTINNQSVGLSQATLNLNSGIYKTENKAMFKGDYVLYYPYNNQFTEGMIPATSKAVFNEVQKNDNAASLDVAENTFRYAYAPNMVGGTIAASFEFKNLSGIVRIVVKKAQGSEDLPAISKLMLYSEKDGFLTKVYLDPSAIAAGKTGTDIYAKGNEETNKTILLNMASGVELEAGNAVYISALPTTISDLVVYAYDATNKKWAACEVGNVEIPAGGTEGIDAVYDADDFKRVYLAVDEATLTEAITNASGATQQNPATIEVLGNITIGTAAEVVIPAYVTVEGDKIIVPEGGILSIDTNATIASDVEVQGQSCCGTATKGGEMWVRNGATVSGTVDVLAGYEGKDDASLSFSNTGTGVSTVAQSAVINVEGTVEFLSTTEIRGAVNIAEDATATVSQTTSDVNVYGGTITNNGTFEVAAGKFALWGAQGSSSAQDGQYFKNNGKFIDNVGTVVGGATANMVMSTEAQYICKVDDQARLDEAYIQKTACNLIQIIGKNSGKAYDLAEAVQHKDKDVDVEVACTGVKFKPSKEVTIGNLSVTSGDLTIDKTSVTAATETTPATYNALHVNGDIELYATFKTEKDVIGMTANNLTVYNQGSATFDKRESRNGVTLDVDQYITVEKGGTLTIVDAASANAALVNCAEVVNHGGTFNGVPNSGR